MKVLVINVNLAVDKTAIVPRMEPGGIHRLAGTLTIPGGKGVNVARVLKTLGLDAVVAGFVSGHNGRWIEERLSAGGFSALLTRYNAGESRICYSIVDSEGRSTDFNEEGPAVPFPAQRDLLRKLSVSAKGFQVAAVCGRVSAGLEKGFYSRMTRLLKKAGCFVAFDTTGWALREGLAAGADAIKINGREFAELSGTEFSRAAAARFFEEHSPRGLQALMVTDGPRPAVAVSQFGLWEVRPPRLKKLRTAVGAGDSFMAGFIYGFVKGLAFEASLRLAAGCAASDCLSLGAGIIAKKEALAYSEMAKVIRR